MAAAVTDLKAPALRPELGSEEWWAEMLERRKAAGPSITGPVYLTGSPRDIAREIRYILEEMPLWAKRGDLVFV